MQPIYNINFTRLINWLVPPRLRREKLLNWLKVLVSQIQTLYNAWKSYHDDVDYRTGLNGQVCRLEGVLNDAFDPELRRINITDTNEYLVNLTHTDEAQDPLPLYMPDTGYNDDIVVIHDDSSYANSGYDFNVNMPVNLNTNDEYRLKSILSTYKLASKRYKILYP